jgi:hypothetical protein
MGNVVKREDNTRDELNGNQKKHNTAGKIQTFVFVGRNQF